MTALLRLMLGGPATLSSDRLTGEPLAHWVTTAVAVLVVLVTVIRRTRGRVVRSARLVIGPLIVLTLGCLQASATATRRSGLHRADVAVLIADLALSVLLGLARGRTVLVKSRADATLWVRYGPATVMLWLLSIMARVGLAILAPSLGATAAATSDDLLAMLGLSLLIQNLGVLARARHQWPTDVPGGQA